MINIEKRHCFWRLNLLADRFQQRIEATGHDPSNFPISKFLSISEAFGIDSKSSALHDVLKLAAGMDQEVLDTHVLFHVIREAVAKIRERNLSFWLTVMTVTAASISWVDFRRKLSKWLSTNGLTIAQSKNIIAFVQHNVDPNSTGLVRKEVFLKFADDLMGYDCLLSPDSIIKLGQSPDVREPAVSRGVVDSSERSRTYHIECTPPETIRTTAQKEYVKFNESVFEPRHNPLTPNEVSEQSMAMVNIRRKLALSSLEKLFEARLRVFFVIFRISSAPSSQRPRQRAPVALEEPDRSSLRSFAFLVKLLHQRTLAHALSRLLSFSLSSERQASLQPYPSAEAGVGEGGVSDEGPSWTVTIQAVAIANLFGILRTCLVRAQMPGFFSLKSGHSIDVYHPIRKILWAQSSQGKKDALVAVGKSRGVLQPIQENVTTNRVGSENTKENIPSSIVEFDLSV